MRPSFELANAVAGSVGPTQEEVPNRKGDKEMGRLKHQDVAVERKTPFVRTDLVEAPEHPPASQKHTLKDASTPI